jgi:DNA mismatch repair protein MSH6
LVSFKYSESIEEMLSYFFEAFNHADSALSEKVEMNSGYDEEFDATQAIVDEIESRLKVYLEKCRKDINCSTIIFKDIGKEIYQLEVPVKTVVPAEWTSMSKTQA